MSEETKPEAMPGDLITRPGVYESRSHGVVEVRHWDENGWVAEWQDMQRYYAADGTRPGLRLMPDPWQLLEWVGPLPPQKPQQPTTSEQIAEIEEQAEPQPVQVREGRWRTRNGEIRHVTPTPDGDSRAIRYPWHDARCDQTWLSSGRYHTEHTESPLDLWEYLGPIEPQPEPELQPAPQAESDFEVRIRVLKRCNDNQAETIGRLNGEIRDLRTELARAEQSRDAHVSRIGHLEAMINAHAETISGLHSEIHGLNMEIGGLNRERAQKDDRIGYLETINAGQAAAVKCAGEQNEKLRTLADNARQQLEAAADEISELRKSLDAAEKQLDQKDAQIRDLRIELEAAQQVSKPLNDEQQEQIWNQATQEAGEQLIRWLRPLTQAMIRQPDDRLCRFMAMTLSIFPDVLPHVLGYAEEQGENAEE